MTRRVPVIEFIRELRAAGIGVDLASLVERPDEYWAQLPAERRAEVLAKLHLSSPEDGPVSVRVVRRRASPNSVENVFVSFHPTDASSPFRKVREALLYRPVAAAAPEHGTLDAQFEDGGPLDQPLAMVNASRRRMIDILDAAWGGDPYDAEAEGVFYRYEAEPLSREIERYVVEELFSMVSIVRDADNRLSYHVVEPRLTEMERALIVTLNERLRDVLLHDGGAAAERPDLLATTMFDLLRVYRFGLDRRTAYRLGYFFLRNYLGFGRLEVLMRDPNIEDISCNGPGIPVYVVHSRHQNLRTSLHFDEFELNSYTIKVAQRGGKLLSVAQPLVDATLPDGSRIQASLGREVTSRGSAFTIRKFRADPLTCVDLIRGGTHTLDSMAFLWLMVEMRRNLVVMGATASGKTTTLNCLSQFIPPTVKIVTIEDTREITLQHENWLASVTRDAFSGAESEKISMYDLLRAALRQRPEYIIVGEIRGVEGLTLFQAMSTGHTCFSTMHAGSVENAVYRLENAPISVPRVMLTSLDMFLLQGQVEVDGRPVRRMLSLTELSGIDSTTRNLRMNEVFRYDANGDSLANVTSSHILEQTRIARGWSRATLDEELAARRRVLAGLVESNQRDYRDVARAVREFYHARLGAEAKTISRKPRVG